MSETSEQQLARFQRMARANMRQRYGYGRGVNTVWGWWNPAQRRMALGALAAETVLVWDPATPVELAHVQAVLRAIWGAIPEAELDR